MHGLFLVLGVIGLIFFSSGRAEAQAQQGTILNEGALVYQEADFDAPVIETLKRGAVFHISTGKRGPFYKIRLKPGVLGWVADTDIKPGVHRIAPVPKKNPKAEEKEKKRKPFFATRYRGPVIEYINYTEDTLGQERSTYLPFFGVKFNGYNTLFDGEIYTESNILVHVGAPSYYADVTKKSADGFIFLVDFLFQTVLPQSKTHLFYYGFGPLFKYSHLNIEVPQGTKTLAYAADDMTLGALFNIGLAFRLGDLSLRTDAKYYWERTRYYGFGLNLGWDF
ncbi:MAG: SH3 domain-containing protein [Bdellovibrio sp.]